MTQDAFSPRADATTARRRTLGSQLRQLRESNGIPAEQAAEAIRSSRSKISRIETGQVGVKDRDVRDLLTLYGVTGSDERAALLTLAREAAAPGWWRPYANVLPSWLEPYLGLEAAASVIRTYQVQCVPGLLQTTDYARALIGRGSAPGQEEINRRAELRISRQDILRGPHPPRLWAVIDESALRRPAGGRKVARGQLRHLIDMAGHPTVTLQILPLSAGAHPAMGGSFDILRFAEPAVPDLVFIEQLTSALYLHRPADLDHYHQVMDQLCLQSDPAAATIKTLSRIIAET
jgi:transcriptional regulator with XRE-family HTH domain